MDKDLFLKIIKNKIKNANLEETVNIIKNICTLLSSDKYEEVLNIISSNIKDDIETDFTEEINDIKTEFKLINEGELSFQSYSSETGEYEWYDAVYDYTYLDPNDICETINSAYLIGTNLFNNHKYFEALELFDLIIDTNYNCEEISDPMYSSDEEIIDNYEIDLNNVEHLLDFKLKNLFSYAINAAYNLNNEDMCLKIYHYLSICDVLLEDALKMNNNSIDLKDFYQFFASFLSSENPTKAQVLLKEMLDLKQIEPDAICVKCYKTNPDISFYCFSLWLEDKQYDLIMENMDVALKEIDDNDIKSKLCYIMADAINNSKHKKDINNYLYQAFIFDNNIPNFIVLLYRNIIDEQILNIVKTLKDKLKYELLLGNYVYIYDKVFDNNENISDNKDILYFLLLYLNDVNNDGSLIKKTLISLLINFKDYHYRYLNIDINNKNMELLELFDLYKNNHKMPNELIQKYINSINNWLSKTSSYILSNQIRNEYYYIARLIVAFDEVLYSHDLEEIRGDFIKQYQTKYVKYASFRHELNKLKEL